ncbi:ArsR/SmtB family transcription factor [Specibacter cremeus]|uniref:ArsR/SmtB family transcription factor n=1 Tax=Specibacter cremeus TaxID=1629051 RepID=UPI000F783DCD|nr:metalloregulator ArsR/SmtB family transcription factor [Specibacter cremeus]
METISDAAVLARFGYALSDATRAQVLMELAHGPNYPAALAEKLAVSRQSMSNHLACLRDCGLVQGVAEGRRTRYELAHPALAHALGDLLGLALLVDPDHATTA